MRAPNFAEVNAFVTIAERGGFAKAARDLGIAPSTLSQMMRGLEERLGVRLLNRTTRSVAPTEAGERLLAQLRPLLDDYANILETLNEYREKPAGALRLTVPPPVASFILAPRLARFLHRYPEIRLEISVDSTLVDIVAGRFDAGIRLGERVERDMIALRISDEVRFVVVGSPDYLTRRGIPQSPHDLNAHNCLRIRFPGGALQSWRFVEDGKVLEVDAQGSLLSNESGLIMQAIVDGAGLAYLTTDYVAPFIVDGRLTPVLQHCMPPGSSGFFLYYPSRHQTPAALQALIGFLRDEFQHGRETPTTQSAATSKNPR